MDELYKAITFFILLTIFSIIFNVMIYYLGLKVALTSAIAVLFAESVMKEMN
jgi:hypothetical protein